MDTATQLTKEIFEQYDWQEVIANCEKNECFDYCSAFCARAAKALESGDNMAHGVFAVLGKATLAALKTGSKNEPFSEEWLFGFTDEELTLFKELVLDVNDAEMRARLADIVWERRRDPDIGRLAVDSYLQAAQSLEGQSLWPYSFDRIERAAHIGRQLGKESDHFRRAITHIEETLARYNGDDASLFSAELMELLHEYEQGDSLKYAALAEKAAGLALAGKEWERARRYLFIEAEWYFLADQPETGRATRLRILETHVREAEEIVNSSGSAMRYNQACHRIERAITGYRDIGGPGAKERREELYILLREYQTKAHDELLSFPAPVANDLTAVVSDFLAKCAGDSVKGQSVVEALRALASLPLLQDVAQLREPIEEFVRRSPVALLFPLVMHSTDGMVSGRPPSKPASHEEQVEAEIRAHMFTQSNDGRLWRVRDLLLPAIDQIKAEHHIRMNDLKQIVVDNPFIPSGREFFFAKGLYAGLMGDYVVAAHLLIPQIENSIRHVLALHGAITSGFSRQDIQNHYDLNRVLTNAGLEEKLANIFSEDLVFELKGLLVQRFGANLRNEIAHGTLGVNEFNSEFYGLQLIYVWWLALRMCFTNVLPRDERSATESFREGK